MLYKLLYAVIIVMGETFLDTSASFLEKDSMGRQSVKPLTEEKAEQLWKIHANDVLGADENYRRAESEQHRVGRIVAWAYTILVAGLLAFMTGFYLWRFRVLLGHSNICGPTYSVCLGSANHLRPRRNE